MATSVQLGPPPEPTADPAPPPAAGSLALYRAVAAGSFRRYSTYRAATLAGAFTNTVFGFVLASTFLALWRARPGLGGYDTAQAVTYIWISQALLATVAVFGGGFQDDIQERFRTGDIAIDLYRPVDFQGWWLAGDLGRAAFHLLARGVAPALAGALAFHLRIPRDPAVWGAFLLSVLLAVVVSFGLRFLVALTGFWLHDSDGVRALALVVTLFFSGMLLPIGLFPGPLGAAAAALPFSGMIQIPADILLGHRTGAAAVTGLGFQLVWAVALFALGRAVLAAATRKVVVQGG